MWQLHPHCTVGKIQAYVDMVLLHNYKPIVSKRCDPTEPRKWAPPPEGWVMVNVDAAVFANQTKWALV
jgi:hypothetical protein